MFRFAAGHHDLGQRSMFARMLMRAFD